MKSHRKLFINDRVKALMFLCFIMAFTILLVFIGIELLKNLPSLSIEQKKYLQQLSYPLIFKILVVIVWGLVSIFSAYLFLLFQYSGFISRISIFFDDIAKKDEGQMFHFRKNDSPSILKESMDNLLIHCRKQINDTEEQIISFKNELIKKLA